MADRKAPKRGTGKRVVDLAAERRRRAAPSQPNRAPRDEAFHQLFRALNLLEQSPRGRDQALADLIRAAALSRQPIPLSAYQRATELLEAEGGRSWPLPIAARPWVRALRAAYIAVRNGEEAEARARAFRFLLVNDKINPRMFTDVEIEKLCGAMKTEPRGTRPGRVNWLAVRAVFSKHKKMKTDDDVLRKMWEKELRALKSEAAEIQANRKRNR